MDVFVILLSYILAEWRRNLLDIVKADRTRRLPIMHMNTEDPVLTC